MSKTSLITLLALIASVTAEPYVYGYGAPFYSPSAAITAATAYNGVATTLPAAYAGAYPGTYAGAYPGAYAGAYPGAYAGAYPAAYTGAYPGAYAGAYPLSSLTAYGSSYGVEELAPLVNPASAPLVYSSPYTVASYLYKR